MQKTFIALVVGFPVVLSCGSSSKVDKKATEIFGAAAQTDQCGPENSFIAKLVPEKWNGLCGVETKSVSYAESCNVHDSCYSSAGAVRETCDQTFLQNLRQACLISYEDKSCLPSLDLCKSVASNYYDAVKSQGEAAFAEAQKKLK